jgi:SAM-dependent methyltransferase
MSDPTKRFTSRVENYVRYRPSYPPAVVELLAAECGLAREALVADIGSGTGLLAERFLAAGYRVTGVEPNAAMRAAGEQLLASYSQFSSVDGTAEATALADRSVDLIVAGQAFHWFDQPRARREFARILRPGGFVALIWNERRADSTPFLAEYEQLLRDYAPDYPATNHRQIDEATIAAFFSPGSYALRSFENAQRFDLAGVRGRLLSSSYAPEAGHPNHQPMLDALAATFERHQSGGTVAFEYDTKVYYGRLAAG